MPQLPIQPHFKTAPCSHWPKSWARWGFPLLPKASTCTNTGLVAALDNFNSACPNGQWMDNFLAHKHSDSGLPETKPCQKQSGCFAQKTLKKIRKDLFGTNLPVSQKWQNQKHNLPIFPPKYQNYFCLLLNKEHGRQENIKNFIGREIKISAFSYNLNELQELSLSPLPWICQKIIPNNPSFTLSLVRL